METAVTASPLFQSTAFQFDAQHLQCVRQFVRFPIICSCFVILFLSSKFVQKGGQAAQRNDCFVFCFRTGVPHLLPSAPALIIRAAVPSVLIFCRSAIGDRLNDRQMCDQGQRLKHGFRPWTTAGSRQRVNIANYQRLLLFSQSPVACLCVILPVDAGKRAMIRCNNPA